MRFGKHQKQLEGGAWCVLRRSAFCVPVACTSTSTRQASRPSMIQGPSKQLSCITCTRDLLQICAFHDNPWRWMYTCHWPLDILFLDSYFSTSYEILPVVRGGHLTAGQTSNGRCTLHPTKIRRVKRVGQFSSVPHAVISQ